MHSSIIPHENIDLNRNEKDIELLLLNFVSKNSLLIIEKLADGLSNIVFAVRLSKNEKLIVKIYGKISDLIINRQDEIRSMIYFYMHSYIFIGHYGLF